MQKRRPDRAGAFDSHNSHTPPSHYVTAPVNK